MNKNRKIALISVLLLPIAIYFYKTNIIDKEVTISASELQNILKRQKDIIGKSKEYTLLQSADHEGIKKYFSERNQVAKQKMLKVIIHSIDEHAVQNSRKFLYEQLLTEYQSLKTKNRLKILIGRVLGKVYQPKVSDASYTKHLSIFNKEKNENFKFALAEGFTYWETLPADVVRHIDDSVVKNTNITRSYLDLVNRIKNHEIRKTSINKIYSKLESYKDFIGVSAYLYVLNNKHLLVKGSESNLIDFVSRKEAKLWDEAKFTTFQKFGLLSDRKDVIRKMSKRSENIWFKKKIDKTLESL